MILREQTIIKVALLPVINPQISEKPTFFHMFTRRKNIKLMKIGRKMSI